MYRLCMQLSLLLVNHTTYHQMCHNNFCRKTMDRSSDETYHHPLIMRKSQGHIHSIMSLVKSFPHLPWGFTICEKRVLIWISSIYSWVPTLLSSDALPLLSDECTTMWTGSSTSSHSPLWQWLRARHPWVWDLGPVEWGNFRSLATASMSKGHPVKPGRNGSFLRLLFHALSWLFLMMRAFFLQEATKTTGCREPTPAVGKMWE